MLTCHIFGVILSHIKGVNTLNERIKKLRKALDLTQQEFSDKLSIKRNTVATYETGKSNPSDAAVVLICKTFNVNETWLRTGEGGDAAMFVQRTKDDELSSFMNELMAEESSDFRRRLVTALARLKPEQWDALEAVALSLLEPPTPPTTLYIAARDGSRMESETDGVVIPPEESDEIPT